MLKPVESERPENGTVKKVQGVTSIYYDGYWIRCYEPPADTLLARKPFAEISVLELGDRAPTADGRPHSAAVSVAGMYSGATGATMSLYQRTATPGITRPAPHHA